MLVCNDMTTSWLACARSARHEWEKKEPTQKTFVARDLFLCTFSYKSNYERNS